MARPNSTIPFAQMVAVLTCVVLLGVGIGFVIYYILITQLGGF